MSIRVNHTYQYGLTGFRFRVLALDEEADVAVIVHLGTHEKRRRSAKPEPAVLSNLQRALSSKKDGLKPIELPFDEVPLGALKGKAKERAEELIVAFQALASVDPMQLAQMNLTQQFRDIAKKLGNTVNAVNLMFTKLTQAGMRLSAIFPKWGNCGRHPGVLDGDHCAAKPTKQPSAYPLSLEEIARIKQAAKDYLIGKLPAFRVRLGEHRRRWQQALRKLPHTAGTVRHPLTKALYAWLSRYDQAWLRRHFPKRCRRRRSDCARDREIAARIAAVAAELRSRPAPTRASRSRIIAILQLGELFGPSARLPRSRAALARHCESHAEFVPRRLRALFDAGTLSHRTIVVALRKQPSLRRQPRR